MYQIGETVRLNATVTNISAEAADPSTIKISINGPDGVAVVEDADMENPEVGAHYYDYTIPAGMGTYRYNVEAVGGEGRITIVKDTFEVDGAF
ncbi:hypothetical protein KA005_02875 [bacterium]|nr:hypothetical protein [bacterium]